MDSEWTTPREAEQIVAGAFGPGALISGDARKQIIQWIIDGRLRVKAIEAIILKPSQDGRDLVRETLENVELDEGVWIAAAAAGRDLSGVWTTSEISFPLTGSQLPDARATYAGVRFSRRDLEDRLVVAGCHRKTTEPEQAAPETTPKLPAWLNPFQLVAWVRYRDASIAEEADTHTNLAAKVYFPTADQIGSANEALDALQSGRLRSYGAERGCKMTEIEPVEWTRIALAPLNPERQHPYDSIRFKREDVVVAFPPLNSEGAAQDDQSGKLPATASTIGLPLPTKLQPVATIPTDAQFEEPKPEWLELWQGPLHFRATYDRGKFGPGHSLERINQYGREGASGGGRHVPIYSVRLDPNDGAIVIEWLIGLPGQPPPYQTARYYHGGLGRGLYNKLRDDPAFRDQRLSHLPPGKRARAVGAYACGLSMREWAEREFFAAVHAGMCEIWARVGSKIAPFRRIPADIFRAYEIQEWGYGVPGGAWAKLEGAEPLYSIRVAAPSSAVSVSQPPTAGRSRKGRAKGTGFQKADALLLTKMAEAIANDPSLNATSAAKLFADEAKGASYEAKVDRLARAFRAGRNGG